MNKFTFHIISNNTLIKTTYIAFTLLQGLEEHRDKLQYIKGVWRIHGNTYCMQEALSSADRGSPEEGWLVQASVSSRRLPHSTFLALRF